MTMWKLVTVVIGVGVAGLTTVLYAGFGAFLPWREHAEADRLANLVGIHEGQTVAEVGAGGGRFSRVLAQTVGPHGRVLASELAGDAYDTLKTSVAGVSNITVVQADREKTNLPDGCCDVLLLRNVYHHVTNPEALLESLTRSLRPGGRIAVIDFEPGALMFHGGRPADASERRSGHGVSQQAAAAEFQAAGFRLEQSVSDWSGPMWLSTFVRIGNR
jgi:ubiquinone/menaquinone biosynthesis C-methylase UbiE